MIEILDAAVIGFFAGVVFPRIIDRLPYLNHARVRNYGDAWWCVWTGMV